MTKISNQYSLTNILTADLANSRLGINNVSPAYSLDLTGTARTSGATYLAITSGIVNVNRTLALTAGTYQSQKLVVTGGIGINSDPADGVSRLSLIGDSTSGDGIIDWGGNGNFNLRFSNNGSERIRITSAGNLGVGTTDPNIYSFGGALLTLSSTSTFANIIIASSGTNSSGISFGNQGTRRAEIEAGDGSNLIFKTNGSNTGSAVTERMRITSGGDLILGIAAAATNVNFDINGVVNKAGRIRFQENGSSKWLMGNGAASENGRFEIYDNVNGTGVQLLRGATSWTALSDGRFKDIIEPIENVIEKFKDIRTVVGKYKTDKEGTRRNFLIAQDLLKVFPEVVDVDQNEENPMGIRYQDLIPVLLKAIQELSAKVSLLENK